VPLLTELFGTMATVEIGLPLAEPWQLTSVSVAGNGAGFALHLAAANSRAGDGVSAVRRHFLQTHDGTGAPVLVRQILDEGDFGETTLFWWEDAWRCLASGHGRTFLIDLDPNGSAQRAVRNMEDRDLMPVVLNGRLFVVTGLDPFEVVAWDRTREQFELVTRTVSAPRLAGWVGGSPGLRTADGFLFLIRRVRPGDRFELVTHRFLAIDDRLCPVAASREFVFQRYGSEVCRGLAGWGQELLCTYASGQGRGWMTAVRSDPVRASLLPLT
jgi:hypothetical protein